MILEFSSCMNNLKKARKCFKGGDGFKENYYLCYGGGQGLIFGRRGFR